MTDVDQAREEEATSALSDAESGPYDDISLTEFKAFIGDDEYAQTLHEHLQANTPLAGFNPWAAVLGMGWFAYRKLYLQGLAALALQIVVPAILGAIPLVLVGSGAEDLSRSLIFVGLIGVRTLLGFWGNAALRQRAVKTIQEVDALNLDNDAHVQMIAACGRVSVGAFFLATGVVGFVDRFLTAGF